MNANNTSVSTTILDLDSLLDTTIDSIETMPDFVTPPAGNYTLSVTKCAIEEYASKDDPKTKKSRFRITYKVEATHEVVAGAMPVADGSLFSETFMATEDGLKFFKKAAMTILNVTDFDGATMRDVIESVVSAEFDARITIRISKQPDGREFENVNIRALPPVA